MLMGSVRKGRHVYEGGGQTDRRGKRKPREKKGRRGMKGKR
jgi:hypothetical protein